jgi:hypothetical protein
MLLRAAGIADIVDDALGLPDGLAVVIGFGDPRVAEHLIGLAYQNRPLTASLSGKQAVLLVFE